MTGYVVQRILAAVPVMFIVGTVVFLLIHLIPGDPAAVMLGPEATPPEVERLRARMGLARPLSYQLVGWYSRLVRGDLGQSIFLAQPVTTTILAHLPPTLYLTTLASLMAIAVGLGSGVVSAIRPTGRLDQTMMIFAMVGASVPDFLWGLLSILLFGVTLHWLPVAGYSPPGASLSTFLRYMILPACSLGIIQAALIARITRASMVAVMQEDYIRTARAKGLSSGRVLLRHALRTALVPTITVVGLTFAILIGGAVVIETIFTIPGLGQLVITSVQRRDYPLIQGAVLFIASIYVVINVLVDLVYALVDPRIKYA